MQGKVFITGGAGTLGKAIIRRGYEEGWDCEFTVFSRDPMKHHILSREFPLVKTIVGDITSREQLSLAMVGHDIVIHAAAMKHIPEAEHMPTSAFHVNVEGSINVAWAAIEAKVKQVVGISTDKVCHPVNAYGATKFMMERIFADFALREFDTLFKLVRYGNVLGSTGSVINVWREMFENDGVVNATDPEMTRYFLTVEDAVDLIVDSLGAPSGWVVIPEPMSLSMGEMAEYVLPEDTVVNWNGAREGEKLHEEMLTHEEAFRAYEGRGGNIWLAPAVAPPNKEKEYEAMSSDIANKITKEHLLEMIGE